MGGQLKHTQQLYFNLARVPCEYIVFAACDISKTLKCITWTTDKKENKKPKQKTKTKKEKKRDAGHRKGKTANVALLGKS